MRKLIVTTLAILLLATAHASALMTFQLEDPIRGLLSNSVIQIVFDGQFVWAATDGGGLAGTSDGGITWITFSKDNAFTSTGVSALGLLQDRLLVSTVNTETDGGGGGLFYTDDHGGNFTNAEHPLFKGAGRISYDFAVFDSVVYSANYYAGLLRSLDGGISWENIFIDAKLDSLFEADSAFAPTEFVRGRYFSAVIDPYHDDTTIVWAGSAEGVQRLYYIGKSKKLASRRINDIANEGSTWWYATDKGVSRFNDTLLTFNSWSEDNGLPANYVSAIAVKGNLVIAGLYDTLLNISLGFAVSTNSGVNWTSRTPATALGSGKMIQALEFHGTSIWAACDQGGLLRSVDNGVNWEVYYPSDLIAGPEIPSPVYNIHAIDVAERDDFSRVTVGTDSGIVAFYFDNDGDRDSVVHTAIADNALYGQKVLSVATFVTERSDEYWAAVKPLKPDVGSRPAVINSTNNGATWSFHLVGTPAVITNDVKIGEMFGDTMVWAATDQGLRATTDFGQRWDSYLVRDAFSGDTIYFTAAYGTVEMSGSETHMGANGNGLAQLYLAESDGNLFPNFRVYKPTFDPNQFDLVGRSYTATGATPGDSALAGNFVVAMGLQRSGDSSLIWASVRPALESGGRNGVSITTDRGTTWRFTLDNTLVWNFQFTGDTAFAASDQGLYMSTDFGESWDQLSIRDPETGRSISDSVAVYDIELIDGDYWVGTDDGIAVTSDLEDWTIIRTFLDVPPEETWATPNPFSPYLGGSEMKFHYKLKNPGKVTITIYDFANNIVKKVLDGVPRQGNVQYDDIDTWNGTNSKGDVVAAGVYLYLLESTGGEELWGKIMVIP